MQKRAHADRCQTLPHDLPPDVDLMIEAKDKVRNPSFPLLSSLPSPPLSRLSRAGIECMLDWTDDGLVVGLGRVGTGGVSSV